jgi:hypothetical protein
MKRETCAINLRGFRSFFAATAGMGGTPTPQNHGAAGSVVETGAAFLFMM